MKKKVVLTCAKVIPEKYLKYLKKNFDLKNVGSLFSEKKIINILQGANGFIVGGEEKINLRILERTSLEWIVFLGIQAEIFFSEDALGYCEKNNIPIYKTGGGICAVAKVSFNEITNPLFIKNMLAKAFLEVPASDDKIFFDRIVGIIGAGNIGTKVLKMLAGKCKLMYYDGLGEKKELRKLGIPYKSDLQEAFRADIVSLHLAFVPGITENIVNFEHLSKINKNGLFINNARANIVNPKGFFKFLRKRPDVFCLWDVFYREGADLKEIMKSDDDIIYKNIFEMPNFIYTGHTAAVNAETFESYGKNMLKIMSEKKLA